MTQNNFLLLPSDRSLTATGVKHELMRGNTIPLSKYKVLNTYWDKDLGQRIVLQKGKGIVHDRYMENVQKILALLPSQTETK